MLRYQHIFISFLILALSPLSTFSQDPSVTPGSRADSNGGYQDSNEGLQLQFRDILAAAREQSRPKLVSLIRQMEIPNYKDWFTRTFGKEKGESWAGPYGRDLKERENYLVSQFLEIGTENGELEIRKVNDAPKSEMESGMIGALQRPVDIFYAGWNQQQTRNLFSNQLIGYFVFLDGRFRWDSTIMPLKVRITGSTESARPEGVLDPGANAGPGSATGNTGNSAPFHAGVGGVTYPACTFCPDPAYPEEARAKHLEGKVVFSAVIMPDGHAEEITLVKTIDPVLTQNALEAILKWRFKPAHGPDGKPVPVIVPIEVTFRLLR
jgi:TonB family protein